MSTLKVKKKFLLRARVFPFRVESFSEEASHMGKLTGSNRSYMYLHGKKNSRNSLSSPLKSIANCFINIFLLFFSRDGLN